VALVAVMVVAFSLTTLQQTRQAQDAAAAAQQQSIQQALLTKQAQCVHMSNHIDQMQGSWWARNFDGNQINELIGQYNAACTNSTSQ
jgi:hypothetical protein